ncbi:MAG: hypothetical protein ACYSR5_04840 [Planctomycetota bacterium]
MSCPYFDPDQLFSVVGPAVILIAAFLFIAILFAVFVIKAVIFCSIFAKAGYHWALGLLMLVPIACIIMPFILAFGRWPIQRELRQLRQQLAQSGA